MINSPCRDCNNRQIGCHDKCYSYLVFRVELDELKNKINKQNVFRDYIGQRIDEANKLMFIKNKFHRCS